MNQTVYQIEDKQTGHFHTVKTCAGSLGALRLTTEQLKKTTYRQEGKTMFVNAGGYKFEVKEIDIPLSWVK